MSTVSFRCAASQYRCGFVDPGGDSMNTLFWYKNVVTVARWPAGSAVRQSGRRAVMQRFEPRSVDR